MRFQVLPALLAIALASSPVLAQAAEGPAPTPMVEQAPAPQPNPGRAAVPPPREPLTLSQDEVARRAGELLSVGRREEAILLLEDHLKRAPKDDAIRQMLLSARIADLEAEIRQILARQADTRDLAVSPPDYAAIKERAQELVKRRLEVAEYFAAAGRPGEAIDACDAILKDHPGDAAVLAMKWVQLKTLEKAMKLERAALLKEEEVRNLELINEVIDKQIMPREKEKIARSVVIFDEDISAIERERVRLRLRERVSLENMVGADVRKVVETLFSVAGINYIILDSAIGSETLTINVVDESLENILQIVSRQVGLRYNYIAGTVYITSTASTVLETEIIRLQSGLTDVQFQPQLAQGGQGADGGGQNGAPPMPQMDPFAQGGQQQGQQKSDLERFLDKVPDIIVGWPAEGQIYLDKKSNSLFIRSTPATIAEVKRLLAALDYNSVQVLIEARFVTVSENELMNLGIDWSGRYSREGSRFIGGAGGTNFGGGTSTPAFTGPLTAPASGIAISGILGDINGNFLGTTLRALESKGKANSLAEPKILTLNNATGLISLENEISYIESWNTTTTTNSNTVNNGTVVTNNVSVLTPQLATEKEEISLRIVPSVARNSDVITLRLSPRIRQLSDLREVDFAYQPSQGSNNIPAKVERPQFADRRLETVLHIRNGQTVALGGLVQNFDSTDSSGLPWVNRIPVLGHLFKSTNNRADRSNLVIFVTATIVDPSGAKVGDDVRLLRDSARVALPQPVREEVDRRAREEADRKAAETGGPAWQRGKGR